MRAIRLLERNMEMVWCLGQMVECTKELSLLINVMASALFKRRMFQNSRSQLAAIRSGRRQQVETISSRVCIVAMNDLDREH
jgi:hypothetical protein